MFPVSSRFAPHPKIQSLYFGLGLFLLWILALGVGAYFGRVVDGARGMPEVSVTETEQVGRMPGKEGFLVRVSGR